VLRTHADRVGWMPVGMSGRGSAAPRSGPGRPRALHRGVAHRRRRGPNSQRGRDGGGRAL